MTALQSTLDPHILVGREKREVPTCVSRRCIDVTLVGDEMETVWAKAKYNVAGRRKAKYLSESVGSCDVSSEIISTVFSSHSYLAGTDRD